TFLFVCGCVCIAGVQAESSVNLSSPSICAVTGSTVIISCTFTTPNSSSVSDREWFLIHKPDEEEQVLKKEPDFSGRFHYSKWRHICELTLKDVRVSDSGVYNFRFKTPSSDWITASPGVHLTVTDLQMKVEDKTVGQRKVKVTCSSTCSLSENLYYFWYKNEERMPNATHDSYIHLDSTSPSDQGSYSCQVSVSLHRSPSMCKCYSAQTSHFT
uniref:Ig-like domain-containing protein n=1 Tax=Astyanax mexicanus TaxID=7994 RepID=A0A8B9RLD3_ASTMX